jgi:glycosyltransferase involved in cell wall biosynthesis
MNRNAENLYLFTNEYPYGTGEAFIEKELDQHLKHFKTVTIFPLSKKGAARPVDARIQVVCLLDNQDFVPSRLIRKHFFHFLNILIREFYFEKFRYKFLRQLPVLKSVLLQNFHRATVLQHYLETVTELDKTVFYSFWTDDWASVLSILKERKRIRDFISRVHGYDLFKERWPGDIIPFRGLQMKNVSKIFAVSKTGLIYLKRHYPVYENKFYLNHLNVPDRGMGPFVEGAIFTVVSCSSLIPLKRVHLIAETLALIQFNMRWVHFGDGIEKGNIQQLVKKIPQNIQVELKGNVSITELVDFYKQHTVHAFMHVSETEGGVPLVLQEAASLGIPLIGSAAGGATEIITDETGISLPVNIEPVYLSKVLTNFKNGPKNTVAFRNGVRIFWKQSFNSATNYSQLHKGITEY